MIIVDDKQVEALESRRLAEEQEQEPPPTYASLHHGGVVLEQAPPPPIGGVRSAATGSSPSISSSQDGGNATRNIKRVNHLAITRTHASIRESVVVDPSLFVPVFLRPPLLPGETEESRRNLRIEAVHGNVWADIKIVGVGFGEGDRSFRGFSSSVSTSTVVGGEDEEEDGDDDGSETVVGLPVKKVRKGKRVFMQLKSTHGGIQAKISGPPNRHPVVVHASATHGDVKLYLPRSFHGPVIIAHRHGFVRFSDALASDLTTFGEVDGIRRCFLGDFSTWAKQAEKHRQRCKEKEREENSKDVLASSDSANGSQSSPTSVSSKDSSGLTFFGLGKDKSHKIHKKQSISSSNGSEWSSVGSNGRSMIEEVAEQSGLGAESGWTGDELLVDVRHANVKLQYSDDTPKTSVKSRPTFLNRIFGF